MPILGDSLPDNAIVVGAASHSAFNSAGSVPLWNSSNRNSLVDLVAPGESIHGLTSSGGLTLWNGTSLAAPQVTGASALLLSQDANLTAAELKTALLDGATRGGRLAAAGGKTYPFLNVHESLAGVAARPGGPLCGNPVWAAGGDLMAARGASAERLGAAPSKPLLISVAHGGRQITIWDDYGNPTGYALQANGSWTATAGVTYGLGGSCFCSRSRAPSRPKGSTLVFGGDTHVAVYTVHLVGESVFSVFESLRDVPSWPRRGPESPCTNCNPNHGRASDGTGRRLRRAAQGQASELLARHMPNGLSADLDELSFTVETCYSGPSAP